MISIFYNLIIIIALSLKNIIALNYDFMVEPNFLNGFGRDLTSLNGIEKFYSKNVTRIDFSFNQLSDIKLLANFMNVTYLNLKSNRIQNVYWLSNLYELKELDLSWNDISSISSLERLVNLNVLKVENNQIKNINFLYKLNKIVYLELGRNMISDLTSLCNHYSSVKVLNLHSNLLHNINPLKYCLSLEKIVLRTNKITSLDALSKLENLTEIIAENNYIREFYVNDEKSFNRLSELNLDSNSLSKFEILTSNLTKLTRIELGNNQLMQIKISSKLINLNFIKLVKNQIGNLFDLIEMPLNIKHLHLSSNFMRSLNVPTKYYSINLETLQLNNNYLTDISKLDVLLSSIHLKYLYLSHNNLKILNLKSNYSNLIVLDLKNNQIESICQDFFDKLINLEYLLLSQNKIKYIESLKNSVKLKNLDLNNNGLENIDFLIDLKSLKQLYLSGNKIKNLTPIENLTQLTFLSLSDNLHLQDKSICWMRNLKNLVRIVMLNFVNITDFDCIENNVSIFESNTIKFFQFSNNYLTNVNVIRYFTMLDTVRISKTQIEDIMGFANLNLMLDLNLPDNRIKNIKPIENLTLIRQLDLSHNRIEDISSIQKLKNLNVLKLTHNRISYIPTGIFDNLNNLVECYLGLNSIKHIDSIGCKTMLKFSYLDLSQNELEYFDFVTDCKNLGKLNVSHNRIKKMPSNLSNLKSLHEIDISFNEKIDDNNHLFIELNRITEKIVKINLDSNSVKLFEKYVNNHLISHVGNYDFYKAYFLNVKSNLEFVDCKLQIEYLSRKILLNLFYVYQIENFLTNCKDLSF